MLPFRRDFTAARLNRVVNDPSVFAEVATPEQEVLELAPLVGNLANIALMCDEGGILAIWREPGVYEIHTQFTDKYRGVSCIKTVREMFSWLFLNTGAMELQSQVPDCNEGAKAITRAIGARLEFERADAWRTRDGKAHNVGYYTLRWSDWLYQPYAMGPLGALGEGFHSALESKKAAFLAPPEGHPTDPAHDVNVGATLSLIYNNQVEKALTLYNRWSQFAGYAPIRLLSREPLIVDIIDAVLLVDQKKETFEVLACRPTEEAK